MTVRFVFRSGTSLCFVIEFRLMNLFSYFVCLVVILLCTIIWIGLALFFKGSAPRPLFEDLQPEMGSYLVPTVFLTRVRSKSMNGCFLWEHAKRRCEISNYVFLDYSILAFKFQILLLPIEKRWFTGKARSRTGTECLRSLCGRPVRDRTTCTCMCQTCWSFDSRPTSFAGFEIGTNSLNRAIAKTRKWVHSESARCVGL